MRPCGRLISIAILLAAVASSLEARRRCEDSENLPGVFGGRSRGLGLTSIARKYYKRCNIESVRKDRHGNMLLSFQPRGCERVGRRSMTLGSPTQLLQGGNFLTDAAYCLINFLQQIIALNFQIPGICCELGLPFSIIFSFLCRGGTYVGSEPAQPTFPDY